MKVKDLLKFLENIDPEVEIVGFDPKIENIANPKLLTDGSNHNQQIRIINRPSPSLSLTHQATISKEELQERFNQQKAKNLNRIKDQADFSKSQKATVELTITQLNNEIEQAKGNLPLLQKEIAELKEELANPTPVNYGSLYEELNSQAAQIEAELLNDTSVKETEKITAELTAKKKETQQQIDSLKSQIRQKETNESTRLRIEELSNQERDLAGKIAEIEGKEFLCGEFTKAKVNLLEDNINSKFQHVKFKMFNQNINGGIEPCCEVLVNGVPFSDVNTAGKVNAGIDVINTLSEFYQISAPIFIDNRESISKLIPTNAQVINLIKVTGQKELTVTSGEIEIERGMVA